MKKTLLILGILLIAAAVISFCVSILMRWAAGSALDISPEHYARLIGQFRLFLFLGIGLSVSGAVMLVIRMILKTKT